MCHPGLWPPWDGRCSTLGAMDPGGEGAPFSTVASRCISFRTMSRAHEDIGLLMMMMMMVVVVMMMIIMMIIIMMRRRRKKKKSRVCCFLLFPKQCGHTEGVLTVTVKARCLIEVFSCASGIFPVNFHTKCMALVKCPCAFRLRRLAQKMCRGIGARHFSCKF